MVRAMLRTLAIAAALLAPAAAHAAGAPPAPPPAPRTTSDPECRRRYLELVDEMQRWEDTAYPEAAIEAGRPTPCPDRITDASFRGIETRQAQTRLFLKDLEAIDPACLAGEDLLGWQLLVRDLRLSEEGHRFRTFLMPVGGRGGPQQQIPQMADRMPFRTEADYVNFLKRLSAVPQSVRDIQELMAMGVKDGLVPPKATMTDLPAQFDAVLRGKLDQLRAPFARMPDSIPAARQAELRKDLEMVIPQILLALGDLRAYLITDYLPACRDTVGASALPEGRARYEHALKVHTTTDMTAQQVHDTGLQEVARIRREMMDVIRRTDWYAADAARAKLGEDELFAAFVGFLRTDPRFYAKSEDELRTHYRDVCKRIDANLPALFGTLPRNAYGVHAVPKFMAPTQTTAYYQPGSLRGGNPGWFCANTYALEQRPLYEAIPLSLHEAVPGHHLQISIAQELPDQPEFRRNMHVTAFVEGWALYAERLGIEMGFFKDDPYSDFGRLTYEMWRSCRLVVDTGLHAFGWPRDRAIEFMKRNTALSELNITREVDRYIDWPGQATGYKIGELRIRAMRAQAERELGPRFDLRAFHDTVLGAGAIPLDVLQARVDAWIASAKAAPAAGGMTKTPARAGG
jgi:uncharacterized protein (DUF885 family)